MASHAITCRGLAEVLLAGAWEKQALLDRLETSLGARYRWLSPFVGRIWLQFGGVRRPTRRELVDHIAEDSGFIQAYAKGSALLQIDRYPLDANETEPPRLPGIGGTLPRLDNGKALAELLGLSIDELHWFADPQGWLRGCADGPLCHYRYRFQPKRDGSLRLLEIPKARLKVLQRRLLDRLINRIPVHPAAHGFVPGRSCLSAATPHAGKPMVMRFDLADFFPSVSGARIFALFHALGYREDVAQLLKGLCTHRTPEPILRSRNGGERLAWERQRRLAVPHLPQGAPSSPALANLAAWRLDRRLSALAEKMNLSYSRYADDLFFSGERLSAAAFERFRVLVGGIAADEGFAVNQRKCRSLDQGASQRLLGMVVNQHPNVTRAEFDRLKAILTNCVRHGPETQNRAGLRDFRAHLQGRISFVRAVNAARGEKLLRLFDRIEFAASPDSRQRQ